MFENRIIGANPTILTKVKQIIYHYFKNNGNACQDDVANCNWLQNVMD
jgi:hypothetical protein